jgi:hypothetical protein
MHGINGNGWHSLIDIINGWHYWTALIQEGKKIKLSVCVSVCVNEIPTLVFYVRTLSGVSSLIWMPLMDGRH